MKYYSLILPILLVAAQLAIGQDTPPLRKLTYKIVVSDPGMREIEGYLFNVSDTSLKISQWPVRFGNDPLTKNNFREVGYSNISEITLKRTHGAGRGAWKGAIVGLLIGVVAGFIEGDDPAEYWLAFTAAEKAVVYGGLGTVAGAGIGTLIGALAKKKFIIGGRKDNFDTMKVDVLTKMYGSRNLPGNSQR